MSLPELCFWGDNVRASGSKNDRVLAAGQKANPFARMQPIALPVAVLLGLLAIWQMIVVVFSLPHFILPGPLRVFTSLYVNAAYLGGHAAQTLAEIILGLILGTCLGIITGLAMIRSRWAQRLVFPAVLVTQALPVFAIAPLLVLWFGYGIASKVIMATLIIYFPITSAFYDGLRRTDPALLDLGQIYGATRWQSLFHFRLPSALPGLSSGLRVGASLAPIGAVVGEWVGSSSGLGFVMLHANARMQTDLMFAALIILAVLVVVLRSLTETLTRRMVFWVPESSYPDHHSAPQRLTP